MGIPTAISDFAFLHFQNAYRVCRQGQCAVGVFRFQRRDHFAVLPGNGPLDFQYATVEINVRPFQSQQFAAPKSGGEVEVVELVHAAVPGFLKEGAELVGGQGLHFLVFDFFGRAQPCVGFLLTNFCSMARLYAEPTI